MNPIGGAMGGGSTQPLLVAVYSPPSPSGGHWVSPKGPWPMAAAKDYPWVGEGKCTLERLSLGEYWC